MHQDEYKVPDKCPTAKSKLQFFFVSAESAKNEVVALFHSSVDTFWILHTLDFSRKTSNSNETDFETNTNLLLEYFEIKTDLEMDF